MQIFSVYIIYSTDLDKYYIGYSEDINKRLVEHNSGISSYTSKARDWKLMWQKEFTSRAAAISEERRIKAKKSRKYIDWLISTDHTGKDG